jgi:hypothetical protein
MAVFDALRHLSVYLRENHPVNHLADLYELVQYAGTAPQKRCHPHGRIRGKLTMSR